MSTSRLAVALPILALATGCTGGPDDTGDTADTADTGVADTGDTAAQVGPITVEVSDDGQPFLGATVVFHAADGAVLGTETVDEYGLASWPDFPADGSVTAAIDRIDERELLTAHTVQPEDFVVLDPSGFGSRPTIQLSTELPGAHGPASTYWVNACGVQGRKIDDPTDAEEIAVPPWCRAPDGTLQLMAIARDSDGKAVAWSFQPDVAPETTSTVTFDSWNTTWTSFDLTVENLPGGLDGDPTVGVFANAEGIDVFHDEAAGRCTASSSQIDCTGLRIPDALDNVGFEVTGAYTASGSSIFQVQDHRGSVPSSASLDLGARAWPRVHETSIDPGARTVSWTQDGDMDGADATLVQVAWEIAGTSYTWIAQFPGDRGGTQTLPPLPSSLQAWWTDSATAFDTAPVVLMSRDSRLDYATFGTEVLPSHLNTRFQGTGDYQGQIAAAGPAP